MSQQRYRDDGDGGDDVDVDEKEFYEFLAQQAALMPSSPDPEGDEVEAKGEETAAAGGGGAPSLFLPGPPGQGQQYTDEELVSLTHRELCFDQPRLAAALVRGGRGCRLLAEALLLPHSPSHSPPHSPSPSERFVGGLLQALARIEPSPGAATATGTTGTGTGASSSAWGGASLSLSILAWTVFGKIPYMLCCRTKTLAEASELLGSYRGGGGTALSAGPSSRNTAAAAAAAAAAGPQQEVAAADGDENVDVAQPQQGGGAVTNGHAPAPPADDFVEVWADESDSSDFCYGGDGDGVDPDTATDNDAFSGIQRAWAAALPPSQSAAPDDDSALSLSWKEAAVAATSLLHECRYDQMPDLFLDAKWKKDICSTVTQVALTLLLAGDDDDTDEGGGGGETPSLLPSREFQRAYSRSHWQQLALIPIHLLRDAAQHHVSTVLPDYLELLRTLMQVPHDQRQPSSSKSSSRKIPTAVWLGLSLYSELCSRTLASVQQPRQNDATAAMTTKAADMLSTVRRGVLEASDDLSLLLERACRPLADGKTDDDDDDDDDQALIHALPWNCLSLFQILSCSPPHSMPRTSAQVLLNSGLFRQWLLVWEHLHQQQAVASDDEYASSSAASAVTSTPSSPVLRHVQQSLFDLCLASSTLLGEKYAWRFPGFAATVTRVDSGGERSTAVAAILDESGGVRDADPTAASVSDAFLWNLLGTQLSAAVASGSPAVTTVLWKKRNCATGDKTTPPGPLPPPNIYQCQRAALDNFRSLVQQVVRVVSDWKKLREEGEDSASSREMIPGQQEVVACFGQVVQRLMSTRLLSELFVSHLLLGVHPTKDVGNAVGKASTTTTDVSWDRTDLNKLQELLARWPVSKPVPDIKVKSDEEDDHHDKNDKEDGNRRRPSLRRKRYAEDDSIDGLRRSVKMLQSLVESASVTTTNSQQCFSSKAD